MGKVVQSLYVKIPGKKGHHFSHGRLECPSLSMVLRGGKETSLTPSERGGPNYPYFRKRELYPSFKKEGGGRGGAFHNVLITEETPSLLPGESRGERSGR